MGQDELHLDNTLITEQTGSTEPPRLRLGCNPYLAGAGSVSVRRHDTSHAILPEPCSVAKAIPYQCTATRKWRHQTQRTNHGFSQDSLSRNDRRKLCSRCLPA